MEMLSFVPKICIDTEHVSENTLCVKLKLSIVNASKRETLQHVERVHLDLALQIHLHLIKHFHAEGFFLEWQLAENWQFSGSFLLW